MDMFISLIIQIISGAVGGNLAGLSKQGLAWHLAQYDCRWCGRLDPDVRGRLDQKQDGDQIAAYRCRPLLAHQ